MLAPGSDRCILWSMLCMVQSYSVKCKQEEFAVCKDFEVAFFEYCASLLVFTVSSVWSVSALFVTVTIKKKIKSRRKKSFVEEWDVKCTECITILFAFRSHSCRSPSWAAHHSWYLFPRSVKCHLRDEEKFHLLPLNSFNQGQRK